MVVQLGVLVSLLTAAVVAVSDSFDSFWDPFPPTGFLHAALI